MGYNTTIKDINIIGKLVEGRTLIDKVSKLSENDLNSLFFTLNEVINSLDKDYKTSNDRRVNEIIHIKQLWKEILGISINRSKRSANNSQLDSKFIEFQNKLIVLFSSFKNTFFILPAIDSFDRKYEFLYEEKTLRMILDRLNGSYLVIQFKNPIRKKELSVFDTFPSFEYALINSDIWPAVLHIQSRQVGLYKIDSLNSLLEFFQKSFNAVFPFEKLQLERSYSRSDVFLFHLSDLHLGNKKGNEGAKRLLIILEQHKRRLYGAKLIPIVSGDLIDHPKTENWNLYKQFEKDLIGIGYEQPVLVPGNHDLHYKGLAFKYLTRKFTDAELIKEAFNKKFKAVKVFKNLKLLLICFDSSSIGKVAGGEIGTEQFLRVGNILDSLEGFDSYCKIVVVHHHPRIMNSPEWLDDVFERRLGKKMYENTMKLQDADYFNNWILERNVEYVLHGHKHIPQIVKGENFSIFSAGSATGKVDHKIKNKTYLSYNVVKYNAEVGKPTTCSIFAEEIKGGGIKVIKTVQL